MQDGKRWITWRGRRFLVNDNGNITKNNKDNSEMMTLYHGSPYKFDKFDLEKSRYNRHYYNIHEGHYFTDDEEIAREMYGEDGYVYEVKVPKNQVKEVARI